jgi:hypothetical protein
VGRGDPAREAVTAGASGDLREHTLPRGEGTSIVALDARLEGALKSTASRRHLGIESELILARRPRRRPDSPIPMT